MVVARTRLLTAAQMRAIEAAAIASGAVTGLELMERAGRGVVAALFSEWPDLEAGMFRAVVLCGPGNNGGDGFVVARLLKEYGCAVEVFLFGDAERLPPDARVNHALWQGMGKVRCIWPNVLATALSDVTDAILCGDTDRVVIVDALFGLGLSRPLDEAGVIVRETEQLEGKGLLTPYIVAIDLPSGLCADSGKILISQNDERWHGSALHARLTVTFHALKLGHVLQDGPSLCGTVRCVDLGLTSDGGPGAVAVVGGPPLAMLDKVAGHKFSHGHALVLSRGVGHGGAARLAARGALRIGAGLVTLGCPPSALIENAARLDAVMLRAVRGAAELTTILADARINALCIGPGLGVERAAQMLRAALGDGVERRSVVVDADGLTALARDAELFGMLHADCVLTPHAGEFARLFPDIAARLVAPATTGPACSKVDATREAARRAGCIVLFKGPDTVIADPSGRCGVNAAAYDRAAPWLATAGSGDVLAGFVTGLLARGLAPLDAAETAAWLHVECARSFGPGLIAEDLPDELPKVFRALGL